MADHSDGMNVHLAHRDVTFVAISRAPLTEIEKFRRRMGWQFKWVSSNGSDFNFDFGVSFTPEERAKGKVYYNYGMQPFESEELPGISVFYNDDAGEVFHTYSTYRRGVEVMMGTYNLLDLTPKGRDERHGMEWVRHHDQIAAENREKGRNERERHPVIEIGCLNAYFGPLAAKDVRKRRAVKHPAIPAYRRNSRGC